MPYHITSAPGKFEVVDDEGKVVGSHPTRKQAVAQLQALYANVPEAKEAAPLLDGAEKAAGDPGDYLVVEDSEKPSTWHLQVRKNGKPDHTLMGAAWAALHGGYRGNKYAGPDSGKALEKLRELYESEEMPLPTEKEAKEDRGMIERFIDWVMDKDAGTLKHLQGEHSQASHGSGGGSDAGAEIKEGRRNATTDQGRLQEIHDLSVMNGAACPMIYKEASGRYRWITISTNSYQDRDGEILSQASLEADIARSDEARQYGPLRWWHMGNPDVETKEAGAGVDIGSCDFRAIHGRMLIESGTFANETIAAALKERAADLSVSVGFFHPFTEPDQNGVYHNVQIFERSLLPRGKESNQLTALTVKGELNNMPTLKEKWDEFVSLVGEEAAQSAVTTADQTDKEAQAKGLKFKEGFAPAEAETKAAAPPADEAEEEMMTEKEVTRAMKALGPHIEKMIKSYLEAGSKERAEKEAGVTAALAELKTALDANVTAVKELQGDLPRSVAAGFRATQSDATILNRETLKEKQADPLGEFLGQFGLSL